MGLEREIRYWVTEGEAPSGGVEMVQAYFLRRPALRIRLIDQCRGEFTLKIHRAQGSYELEGRLPVTLVRLLLRLPLPRVEKLRLREGPLEVDTYFWPRRVTIVECELSPDDALQLGDSADVQHAWKACDPAGWSHGKT